jgi:hypothetical protein
MPFDNDSMTFDQLDAILSYDGETGKLWWKAKTASKVMVGMEAGCTKATNVSKDGQTRAYRYVRVFGKSMAVARVAWLLTHGEWPTGKICFDDGNQLNLKINNLRMSNSMPVKYDHNDAGSRADYLRDSRERFPLDWKDSYLRSKFKITLAEYGQMLVAQNGVCAICNEVEKATRGGKPKALAVDHDHATGAIRALLCSECNQMLGKAKDNRDVLLAAVKYLDKHAGRTIAAPTLTVVPTEESH